MYHSQKSVKKFLIIFHSDILQKSELYYIRFSKVVLNHRSKINFTFHRGMKLISKNQANEKSLFEPATDTKRLMDSYEAESAKTREVNILKINRV